MARIPQRTLVAPSDSGANPNVSIPEYPIGAYNASIKATVGLIQSLGGVADHIAKEGRKAQDVKNASDQRSELRNMRMFQAQFQQDMQTKDPSQWGVEWANRLKGYEAQMKSKGYAPVVQRALQEGFKDFAGRSALQITGMALKENRRMAKGIYTRDLQDLYENRDFDGAHALLEEAGEQNIFDDLELRDGRKRVEKARKQTTLDDHLQADPLGYKEQVKTGSVGGHELPPWEQKVEIKRADREAASLENQSIKALNELAEMGEIKTVEDLQFELENSPEISDTNKKRLIKNFQNSKPVSDKLRYGLKDKFFDSLRKFKEGKIPLEDFKDAHREFSTNVEALGKRPNTGHLRSFVHRYDPIGFSMPGDDEDAVRAKAKAIKDINSYAYNVIRNRIGSMVKQNIAREKFDTTDETDSLRKIKFVEGEKEASFALTRALERDVTEWVESETSAGREPNDKDVIEYIDKNQQRVINNTLMGEETPRGVNPLSSAERAYSLLPPLSQ